MKLKPTDQGQAPAPIPTVTKELIESRIKDVAYFHIGLKTTICNITMVNGFSILGESFCVDPRQFDADKGNELAYKNAFDKIWALENYLLAERLSIAGTAAV